jgi:large subunit ribosomal protein L18
MSNFISLNDRRKQRNRSALRKKAIGKLRLSVFRSGRHIYSQIIDDLKGETLASASSLDSVIKDKLKTGSNIEAAVVVGKYIAEKALKKGITKVVFDRGGYIYHGRVKSLAEAARDGGLIF